jgi:large subunit ribosomal protein L25
MMENILNIEAESRQEVGKEISKKLRAQGKIPAIIYGGKSGAVPITLWLKDIKTILKAEKGENSILSIHRDDVKVDAMLKDIQYDFLSNNIIHVDFIRIELDKPIEVNVPVVLSGEPIGVRLEDGIFDFISRELKIRCLPARIPKSFEVDISDLHTGHTIKVSELSLSKEFEFLSDPQTVICGVSAKGAVEEEVVKEEVEEEVEGEKPEVEEGKEEKEKEKEGESKEKNE